MGGVSDLTRHIGALKSDTPRWRGSIDGEREPTASATPRLRGWHRGHRPSEPDPGNAGGGNWLDREARFRRGVRGRWGDRPQLRLARHPARGPGGGAGPGRAAGRRHPRRRGHAGPGRRARLRRAGAAGDDLGLGAAVPGVRRRPGGGERGEQRLRAPGRPPHRPRPRRGGGAAARPRPAAIARARGRVAAATSLPRARAGPDALVQRRRPRARRGGGRPAGADRGAADRARRGWR